MKLYYCYFSNFLASIIALYFSFRRKETHCLRVSHSESEDLTKFVLAINLMETFLWFSNEKHQNDKKETSLNSNETNQLRCRILIVFLFLYFLIFDDHANKFSPTDFSKFKLISLWNEIELWSPYATKQI